MLKSFLKPWISKDPSMGHNTNARVNDPQKGSSSKLNLIPWTKSDPMSVVTNTNSKMANLIRNHGQSLVTTWILFNNVAMIFMMSHIGDNRKKNSHWNFSNLKKSITGLQSSDKMRCWIFSPLWRLLKICKCLIDIHIYSTNIEMEDILCTLEYAYSLE